MQPIKGFTMPKWGIEMEEGVVREWHAEEGQTLKTGDMLVVIETDKIANEVELEYDATLRRRIAEEGDVYKVGQLIAVFAESETPDADIDDFIANFKAADAGFGDDEPADEPAQEDTSGFGLDIDLGDLAPAPASASKPKTAIIIPDGMRLSPKAEELARELGVDLTSVSASRRSGRVSLQDIEQAAKKQGLWQDEAVADDMENPFDVVKFSGMRRTIAKRMAEASATIPHFYLRRRINVDALIALRESLKEEGGKPPSLNDYLVKACAMALRACPDVNVHFGDQAIHRFKHAAIAVAVSVPGGLVTPVVRKAEMKSVQEIQSVMRDLGSRARDEKLTPEEYAGGTFTVSNLGMFGVDNFDAIINPPQGAILAIGTLQQVATIDGAVANVIDVSLGCDHRVIDGALGGQYLAALNDALQSPEAL